MTLDQLIELLETSRDKLKAETGRETFYMLDCFGGHQVDYRPIVFEHDLIDSGHWYGIHLKQEDTK